MPTSRSRRYSIEIKSATGATVLATAADWNDEERRVAVAQIMRLESRPFDSTTRLYWIDVKDERDIRLLFTTVDWSDDDRLIGVAQVLRLAGQPDDNGFIETLRKG